MSSIQGAVNSTLGAVAGVIEEANDPIAKAKKANEESKVELQKTKIENQVALEKQKTDLAKQKLTDAAEIQQADTLLKKQELQLKTQKGEAKQAAFERSQEKAKMTKERVDSARSFNEKQAKDLESLLEMARQKRANAQMMQSIGARHHG